VITFSGLRFHAIGLGIAVFLPCTTNYHLQCSVFYVLTLLSQIARLLISSTETAEHDMRSCSKLLVLSFPVLSVSFLAMCVIHGARVEFKKNLRKEVGNCL
jgi:4-hydroxybenzoate polyprenyltransferase